MKIVKDNEIPIMSSNTIKIQCLHLTSDFKNKVLIVNGGPGGI